MDGMSELSQDDSETEIASSVVSTRRPMGLIGLLCEVCCSIVLVCGIGLIVTAISLTETLFKYTDPFDTGLAPYTVTVGILGCLVLIASVFGIAAMFTEDQFLLFLSEILIGVVMISQATCTITGFISLSNVKKGTEYIFLKYFSLMEDNRYYQALVNRTQRELKCCGIYNATDYDPQPVPQSCMSSNAVFVEGCMKKLMDTLHWYTKILCVITLVTLIPELLSVLSATCYRKYAYSRKHQS